MQDHLMIGPEITQHHVQIVKRLRYRKKSCTEAVAIYIASIETPEATQV